MKLSDIKRNPNNPRVIKDEKFQKLVQSIREFPKMMALRPMVLDTNNIVLGGNQRLKALTELGYKDIPDEWVKYASDLTDDEIRRFIIVDNVGFGEHDWELLRAEWNLPELDAWGLDVPEIDKELRLPEDEQKEPENFDGFIVVLKIQSEIFPIVKDRIENLCTEYGIQIDIS